MVEQANGRKRAVEIWLEGWRVLWRLCTFLVWLWLALVPFKFVEVMIRENSYQSNPAVVAAMILIVLAYSPFALYFAAAQSGHFRAKAPPVEE